MIVSPCQNITSIPTLIADIQKKFRAYQFCIVLQWLKKIPWLLVDAHLGDLRLLGLGLASPVAPGWISEDK